MKYHYMSQITGEIACTLREVIRIVAFDLLHFGFLNLRWKYDKAGF